MAGPEQRDPAPVSGLQEQMRRWSRPGVLVVPDTSFYIRHPDKLEDADFASLLGLWEDPVRVLVPIVIAGCSSGPLGLAIS